MTLSRGKWLRSFLTALAVMIAPPSASTVLAQGAYGADPFRPYNRQYDPYTYPMGPASPAGGQGGAIMPRMGNDGANQYQGYLDELSGAGRQGAERYGIGMPYYRSVVDPSFDTKGTRDYRPNRDADRTYEQTHEVVTRKYLAYFTEQDPRKRAELLRDYNQARSRASRAMSGRRESPSRMLEAATATGTERHRPLAAARGAEDRSDVTEDTPRSLLRPSVRTPSFNAGRRVGAGAIPAPPPLEGPGSIRRAAPRRSPTDVLDRSRRLDRSRDVKPSAGAPVRTDSGASRQPVTAPLPPE